MSTQAGLWRYEAMLGATLREALARATSVTHPSPDLQVGRLYASALLGDAAEDARSDLAGLLRLHRAPAVLRRNTSSRNDTHRCLAWHALVRTAEVLSIPAPVNDGPTVEASTDDAGNITADWARRAWMTITGQPGGDDRTFARLVARQQPAGHFFTPSPSDNLEVWWYEELVVLHLLGLFAATRDDAAALTAAERAATFHLNETQPDHASTEPWAVFPFLLLPETRSLADQVLHSAMLVPPNGVSLMLLGDALYCLHKPRL